MQKNPVLTDEERDRRLAEELTREWRRRPAGSGAMWREVEDGITHAMGEVRRELKSKRQRHLLPVQASVNMRHMASVVVLSFIMLGRK